jgi:hypothetical protein
MTRYLRFGGLAAAIVLIAFGAGALYTGLDGRSEVRHDLAREQIVGTPDMAGVANQKIDTGAKAKKFAAGMRKHTLEATGGQTYAQMGRYLDKAGQPTNDEKLAAVDPKSKQPVENPLRNLWVTETALTTALNTSFFAESVASFAVIMGVALLLTGIGFLVVSLILLRSPATEESRRRAQATGTVAASH